MNLFLKSQKLKHYSPLDLASLLQGPLSLSHLLQIHAQIFVVGAHRNNLIATRLINHYSRSPSSPYHISLHILHSLPRPNLLPFNALLITQHAFSLFKSLKHVPLSPNAFTFSSLLKSCNDSLSAHQIHTHVLKTGFLSDPFVCNALVAAYAKGLKDLASARKVFGEMPDKASVCCWTSLLAGYVQSGHAEDALRVFVMMVEANLPPEDGTLVSVLSACSSLDMSEIGRWVLILSRVDGDLVGLDSVKTVLVYLYGKWGKVEKSREILMEFRRVGSKVCCLGMLLLVRMFRMVVLWSV